MSSERSGSRPFYSERDVENVLQWKAEGDTNKKVAKRLGRGATEETVRVLLSKINNNKRDVKTRDEIRQEERGKMLDEYLNTNITMTEMARARSVSVASISQRLSNALIDARTQQRGERRPFFTKDEAELMLKMKKRDATDEEIAQAIGGTTTAGSIAATLSKIRNNKREMKTKHEVSREKSEKMADAYLADPKITTRSLARTHGVTQPAIVRRLKQAGVDKEVREEYRRPVRV